MKEKNTTNQKGAVSAIAVFFFIVVIGGMVTVSLMMSTSSLTDSNQQNSSTQAMYLAESALERVVFNLNNDPDCNNLVSPDQQTLGNSTFEIVSIAINVADQDCDIKVKAETNSIVHYINAKIFNFGGAGGGGGGGGGFVEHFPNFNGWAWVPTSSQGSFTLGSTCTAATCTGYDGTNVSSGSSVEAVVTTSGGWNTLAGYGWKTLDTPIDTTTGAVTLDFAVGWKKNVVGSTAGVRQRMSLELEQSSPLQVDEIWREWNLSTANTWTQDPIPMASVTLSAGRVYNRIRFNLELKGRAGRVPYIWIDEIILNQGGGGGSPAPDWQVVKWQEVSN